MLFWFDLIGIMIVIQLSDLILCFLSGLCTILGAFAWSGFSKSISVAKSPKLRKSATEKRNAKKHLSLSVVVRNRSTRTEFRDRK